MGRGRNVKTSKWDGRNYFIISFGVFLCNDMS